ncbi:PREDICTED: protodermal factor 1-like [Charadrius vociferus]|uniref:protodermal factor 1-like n=1 Tax=Charadrius vociferus TaxID=50402 RepID=UPI0005213E6C|nr:PREDICTED: protodermal factor 1-like [Charadrius vociferus]
MLMENPSHIPSPPSTPLTPTHTHPSLPGKPPLGCAGSLSHRSSPLTPQTHPNPLRALSWSWLRLPRQSQLYHGHNLARPSCQATGIARAQRDGQPHGGKDQRHLLDSSKIQVPNT